MEGGNLLLTGSTGALGPPLLDALLSRQAFERIYLMIRPGAQSLQNRFAEVVDAVRISGDFNTIAALPKPVRRHSEALDFSASDRALRSTSEPASGVTKSLLGTCGSPLIDANLHRLIPIAGDVTGEIDLDVDADVVIHAAADTRFRAPRDEQVRINVDGTRNMIAWAKRCPKLKRFVFVSTICVAGHRVGRISETAGPGDAGFTNDYESSKWRAEQLVRESCLPATIARVSLVIGSERTGAVHRPGAVHHALRWLYRGLVPMIPGTSESTVDLISSELASACLSRLATLDGPAPDLVHIAAGQRAIPLAELLDFAVELFGAMSPAWRQGQIARPMIVDDQTFELFRDSVQRSGDVLFRSVLDSVASFLPGLLYPKVYETTRAEGALGGPLPLGDWRPLIQRVIHRCVTGDDRRILPREVCLG